MSVASWIRGVFGSRPVPVYELGKAEPVGNVVEPLKPFGIISHSSVLVDPNSGSVGFSPMYQIGSGCVLGYGPGIIRASINLDLYKPICSYCGSKNDVKNNHCKQCGAPL